MDYVYPNMKGYLAPYKGERYHMPNFHCSSQPQNVHKIFKNAHSSLRTTIERTFRVWKARWYILQKMSSYKFNDQVAIVIAIITLHNFIQKTYAENFEYD